MFGHSFRSLFFVLLSFGLPGDAVLYKVVRLRVVLDFYYVHIAS